ncbi:hypothetical protein SLEP1_g11618 [Rubroshorea leprosula]|nr:hypothetical protein SLEP1_g11618 [Rubroshorea leprosula]
MHGADLIEEYLIFYGVLLHSVVISSSSLSIPVKVVVSKLQQWEQIERHESCNMTAQQQQTDNSMKLHMGCKMAANLLNLSPALHLPTDVLSIFFVKNMNNSHPVDEAKRNSLKLTSPFLTQSISSVFCNRQF